jgi:hypothetical protein
MTELYSSRTNLRDSVAVAEKNGWITISSPHGYFAIRRQEVVSVSTNVSPDSRVTGVTLVILTRHAAVFHLGVNTAAIADPIVRDLTNVLTHDTPTTKRTLDERRRRRAEAEAEEANWP